MIKTLSFAAALAAFATTASAATEIHVSLVGKDMKTIRADVQKAARIVCREELATLSTWTADYATCIDDSVARALAQLPNKAS